MCRKTDPPAPGEQIIELLSSYVNLRKKPYETSHSRLSLKIRHCSIFGKTKKTPTKDLLMFTFYKITVLQRN